MYNEEEICPNESQPHRCSFLRRRAVVSLEHSRPHSIRIGMEEPRIKNGILAVIASFSCFP